MSSPEQDGPSGPVTRSQVAERLAGAQACLAALRTGHAATPHLWRVWARRIGELEDQLRVITTPAREVARRSTT